MPKSLRPTLPALLLCAALATCALPVSAAPLRDVPQTLTQPDGSTVACFASGDEFYHWLHDAAGYAIVQDAATGAWVYARAEDGLPRPTALRVGKADPASAGLVPGPLLSPERYRARRESWTGGNPARSEEIAAAPPSGTLNSVVIFVRFSDEPEYADTVASYDAMFNDPGPGKNSMRNYFLEASYGDLEVLSHYFPVPQGATVLSYQDSHPRAYFRPKSATNPDGYEEYQRKTREMELLEAAVNAIAPQVPADLPIDADGDGRVDSTCFVVSGSPDGWSDLLWPHMWTLDRDARIKGKRVFTYSFQLANYLRGAGNGVLSHEMFHVLGAPDLYHYDYDGLEPVGRWDIMEGTTNPPQHMGAYMKFRYGLWIDSIPEISEPGTYLLNPLTSSAGQCFKIPCPASTASPNKEYFVVEFRKKQGTFEGRLPDSGLLVYRINPNKRGNANGPPDEVYLYRPGGTTTQNGSPNAANYSAESCRVQITDATQPPAFLTDGSLGGLTLTNVGSPSGETLSFELGGTQHCTISCMAFPAPTEGTAPLEVYFEGYDQTCECASVPDYRWDFGDGQSTEEDYPTHTYADPGTYTYTLTVTGDGGVTCTTQGTISVMEACTLTCTAEAAPTSGAAPLPVAFTAIAAGCSGASYAWAFGDGATSTEQNPGHTYTQPGTYAWSLTVSAQGQTCAKSGSVTVADPCALTCDASATPSSGHAPLSVAFDATVQATSCTGQPEFLWAFGDGATSALDDPQHTYTSQGTYAWSLTVTQDGVTCARSGSVEVAAPRIPGDCDDDGSVSIGEVQKAINMFLGLIPPDCGVDCNGDGTVSIGEVQKVINNFLGIPSLC